MDFEPSEKQPMVREYTVGRLSREARVTTICERARGVQRMVIARALQQRGKIRPHSRGPVRNAG